MRKGEPSRGFCLYRSPYSFCARKTSSLSQAELPRQTRQIPWYMKNKAGKLLRLSPEHLNGVLRMETANLENFPTSGDHLLFGDAVKDDLHVMDTRIRMCHFRRIGAKKALFERSSLTQCLFEDTYFRNASFTDVRLTGSTFRNCNLEKAIFKGCDLRYCTFQTTRLDRDEIIGNLPVEPNLKRDLARNLRKNFEALGDKDSADIFLDIEIEAHEQVISDN